LDQSLGSGAAVLISHQQPITVVDKGVTLRKDLALSSVAPRTFAEQALNFDLHSLIGFIRRVEPSHGTPVS
jgi:hypothetical protein